MTKYKLEYIWLDGKQPVPGLRGKSLLKAFEHPPTLADLPNWGFDGSAAWRSREAQNKARSGTWSSRNPGATGSPPKPPPDLGHLSSGESGVVGQFA